MARLLGLKQSGHVPALLAGRITPNVATCLRIARATKMHPSTVLAAAGHQDVVDVFENAYVQPKVELPDANLPEFKRVRWLHAPIAAGQPLAIEPDDEADNWLAFRDSYLKPYADPICLTVGRAEQSMLPTIQPGDVVLLDQRLDRRASPTSGQVYAVNLAALIGDPGGTVKRIEIADRHLVVLADNPDKTKYPTRVFTLEGLELPKVLIGKVVWIGRNLGERRRMS